jgi:hypothetical protein
MASQQNCDHAFEERTIMTDGGRGNNDDQFQGSLNADEEIEQNEQNVPENVQGLDLGAILGGLMGGGQPSGMPDSQQGGQGGLDLGSLLGGLLGGQMGGQPGSMPDAGAMGGMAGTPFDGIIGGVAGDLSQKTGLPKEIITMGAMFLVSKLMSGALGGNQEQGGQQAGGLDLGGLLGSILGGGGLPGMDQGMPQQGGMSAPQGDEVLGKIGKQIGEGLNSPQLTAGGLQQSGLASEFSQMSGLSEDEAAQSLNQIVNALKQNGLGQ